MVKKTSSSSTPSSSRSDHDDADQLIKQKLYLANELFASV